jgi:hypothetical protein
LFCVVVSFMVTSVSWDLPIATRMPTWSPECLFLKLLGFIGLP